MTSAGPIPVLFVHYGDQWIRGSEQVLLELIAGLDRTQVRPALWTNGAAMAADARAAGVPTTLSGMAYYLDAGSPPAAPLRYLRLVGTGMALARRHGARVIHANSAAPVQWMLPAARLSGRKLLVHLHIGYLRRSRAVLGLRFVDRAVGVSGQVLEGLIADGLPPARARVIPNGVSVAYRLQQPAADLRAEAAVPPDALVLAAVGFLVPMKGYDVLLDALARLPPRPAWVLLLAGDGPDRARLAGQAAALGLGARVRFLGHVSDVTAVYRAADLLVQPSRNEGFSLSAAEAGLFALPVVATRVGGLPEVVTDGVTGLLVPADQPTPLASALARLMGDPALRSRLGAAGAARVRALFDPALMPARFAALYAELAGLRASTASAKQSWPSRGLTGPAGT